MKGDKWEVEGSISGPATSKPHHTFIMSDNLRKQIEEQAKAPHEKEKLTKGYEKAKLHEVVVYIARVMRKNQHTDSIKCAYNF
jgi:hypothetical protein